jgi:hypothetical protein
MVTLCVILSQGDLRLRSDVDLLYQASEQFLAVPLRNYPVTITETGCEVAC